MRDGIPVLFDYDNLYTSQIKPGTVHSRSTTLTRFFERIFMQRMFSVFEYDLPEEWDRDYFLYVLWIYGFGCVMNTDKYGVIFQQCTLSGYNVYYRPAKCLVSNPLLKTRELTINVDTALIKCTPDYRGVYDIISYYADMAAIISESFGINVLNTRLAYVFSADNSAMAESFKKMYDKISAGDPAVAIDKKLFDENGDPRWLKFDNNIRNTFIGKDLLECMQTVDNMFCTTIGIKNANYEKRERLLTDEVNANNQLTESLSDVWLDTISKAFEKANEMFGLNLAIRRREEPQEVVKDDNDNRPV